jgi:hypothetical protein
MKDEEGKSLEARKEEFMIPTAILCAAVFAV